MKISLVCSLLIEYDSENICWAITGFAYIHLKYVASLSWFRWYAVRLTPNERSPACCVLHRAVLLVILILWCMHHGVQQTVARQSAKNLYTLIVVPLSIENWWLVISGRLHQYVEQNSDVFQHTKVFHVFLRHQTAVTDLLDVDRTCVVCLVLGELSWCWRTLMLAEMRSASSVVLVFRRT